MKADIIQQHIATYWHAVNGFCCIRCVSPYSPYMLRL